MNQAAPGVVTGIEQCNQESARVKRFGQQHTFCQHFVNNAETVPRQLVRLLSRRIQVLELPSTLPSFH
ncbi:hypothetical protein RRG08_019153 [Elysia crispata]|uniref:Uncharacterized protein n=1 Tax=Elysia crispata TaxID=231223 RepID=A0AAE1BCD7_9GAST|nr:hypothetical protein RRG08_019153 [Elysia crispata]